MSKEPIASKSVGLAILIKRLIVNLSLRTVSAKVCRGTRENRRFAAGARSRPLGTIIGPDGHTASLVPGDAVLKVNDADVAVTGIYQGRRRMTLTYPILNRARRILWLVTGSDKAGMLLRLRDADPSIPAGSVNQERALVLADRAAARKVD